MMFFDSKMTVLHIDADPGSTALSKPPPGADQCCGLSRPTGWPPQSEHHCWEPRVYQSPGGAACSAHVYCIQSRHSIYIYTHDYEYIYICDSVDIYVCVYVDDYELCI